MLIDTHAHLMFDQFKDDLDEVVERALAAGVSKIVNIGCSEKDAKAAVAMSQKFDCCYATVGMHPYHANDITEQMLDEWRSMISENEKIVAIGECGLDYYKSPLAKDVQELFFRKQLDFAQEVGLPVVIHCRDAYENCLRVLEDYPEMHLVVHCYTGPLDFAQKIWSRGGLTSFTGCVTYKLSDELFSVLENVPLQQFMIETDCPFLAPQEMRGQRNEPSYVGAVAKKIAEVKGMSFEELAKISTENAEKFFGI